MAMGAVGASPLTERERELHGFLWKEKGSLMGKLSAVSALVLASVSLQGGVSSASGPPE